MFASPLHKKGKTFRQQDVEKSLTSELIPALKNSNFGTREEHEDLKSIDLFFADSPSVKSTGSGRSAKTFRFSPYDTTYIDHAERTTHYKVLTYYTKRKDGTTVVFDPRDGTPYNCETRSTVRTKVPNRMSHEVVVFDSKVAAMSEKFPQDQVRIRYARLCGFKSMIIMLSLFSLRLALTKLAVACCLELWFSSVRHAMYMDLFSSV